MLHLVVWVSRVKKPASLRACLHGGGKPQIDAVTLMSSSNLDALSRIFAILNDLEQTQ